MLICEGEMTSFWLCSCATKGGHHVSPSPWVSVCFHGQSALCISWFLLSTFTHLCQSRLFDFYVKLDHWPNSRQSTNFTANFHWQYAKNFGHWQHTCILMVGPGWGWGFHFSSITVFGLVAQTFPKPTQTSVGSKYLWFADSHTHSEDTNFCLQHKHCSNCPC